MSLLQGNIDIPHRKEVKMIAQGYFLGKEYAQGFEKGEFYRLRLVIKNDRLVVTDRLNKQAVARYTSFQSFTENWRLEK